jgi:ADP-heptose:LPS heptosyltransferase
MVKRCAKKGGKRILLGWNRGLGDLALGLFAVIQRIREIIPEADITFLTRDNLQDGFTLLEGVKTILAPDWKRGEPAVIERALKQLGLDPKSFDLIIEKPSPTDWVRWQLGKVVPRLKWNPIHDDLWKKFNLLEGFTYIGVQAIAETNYGLWRNWPLARWQELFQRLEKFERIKILLFGFGADPSFTNPNLIDLRGKTNLFEFLSIVKNRCKTLILPDSGLLSMTYFLDESFPIQVISLWADPNHGVLKQAVPSPNPQLVHHPMIGNLRDLSSLSVDAVLRRLLHVKPLYICHSSDDAPLGSLEKVGCILLAGGQGSRLGFAGPKGTFPILGKSLFQWICEKAPEKDFPIAVMTSPLNHEETVAFFQERGNFGREVYFFQQDLLPFLDDEKQPLKIAAPDGNGGVYRAFARSGLKDLFLKRGIDLLTIVPVENAMADPADRRLIGYLRATGSHAVVKCVKREKVDESMGVLVEREGRIEIVEYIDLDPTLTYEPVAKPQFRPKSALLPPLPVPAQIAYAQSDMPICAERGLAPKSSDLCKKAGFATGSYAYSYAGMMAMSLPFFLRMAEIDLPIHCVKKQPPGMEKVAWKQEKFLFDALPYADRVSALSYPKLQCYAPLKNLDSIRCVEQSLKNKTHSLSAT